MTILLAAGERVPVDGRVLSGQSDLDCSLVSGESVPQPVGAGSLLQAGTLNLTGPLTIVATAAAKDSFLAEMLQMMEAAESGRSAYRRIADRASRLYAPVVHLSAAATFIGWMAATGDVHRALTIAIAVLIITCPCALGLAVPMVQVVAARRLFERGIMVKDGGALERLAEVDTVVFDKTGTLTIGTPQLLDGGAIDPDALALAAAIASHSRHPYSLALAAAGSARAGAPIAPDRVSEYPGSGLEALIGTAVYRLGRPEWALAGGESLQSGAEMASVILSKDGRCLAAFQFEDRLRSDAREAVAALVEDGLAVEILSGDREQPVRQLASAFGVSHRSQVSPGGKAAHIAALGTKGSDGRRWAQRRTGTGCRARLDGAGIRRRCRPQRRRSGVPAREPAGGAAGDHRCSKCKAAGPRKSGHRRRLQCDRNADRHLWICDAADRGGGHVTLVTDRGCQCTASWWRSSENATPRRFVERQSFVAAICTERQMTDFFYLIPVALALGAVGLAAFMWSLKSGQYEDLEGAAERILSNDGDKPIVKTRPPPSGRP